VSIESGLMGKSYILVIEDDRKMLAANELLALVKIVHSGGAPVEAQERLFRWIKDHRDDIIMDTGLTLRGAKMEALYTVLKTKFMLKK